MAVPSQDFTQNSTGSGVGWRWWQVFLAMGKSFGPVAIIEWLP
jgi:hypothetical protein